LLWSDDAINNIVPLYSCNNLTLKMAAIATETCWWEHCNKTHHKNEGYFVGYLYIMIGKFPRKSPFESLQINKCDLWSWWM